MFEVVEQGYQDSEEFYNKWVAEVKALVPPERLLVFEAKQGWEPLCRFLDLPVPKDEPYPATNDTVSKIRDFENRERLAAILVYGLLPIGIFLALMWAFDAISW